MQVPLLIGSNIQEFSFGRSSVIQANAPPDPPDALKRAIEHNFGDESQDAMAAYGLVHSDAPPSDPQLGSVGTQLMTDTLFRCPARIAGDWLSKRGVAVWEYQFERPLPGTAQRRRGTAASCPTCSDGRSTRGSGRDGRNLCPCRRDTLAADAGILDELCEDGRIRMVRACRTGLATAGNAPALMHFTADGTIAASVSPPRATCGLLQTHIEQALQSAHP